MYRLCRPGKSSKNCPVTATLSPICVKEMMPRTVLPFLGVTLATPIGPFLAEASSLAGVPLQPAKSSSTARPAIRLTRLGLVDDAAGHARAGVARGLCLVVVRVLVHDDRLADDVGGTAADR